MNEAGVFLFILAILSLMVLAFLGTQKAINYFTGNTAVSKKDDKDDNSHLNIPPSTE